MNRKPFFKSLSLAVIGLTAALSMSGCGEPQKLKLLLIDGQNNHAWKETTPVMVEILEGSGRFDVTVSTSPPSAPKAPRKPKENDEATMKKFAEQLKAWELETKKVKEESAGLWDQWRPDFSAYDVVVSNYNGELWPEEVQKAFEDYVRSGGGFVSVHAADNSFPEWKAYNEMIAVGGWGGRSELSGPYLRLRDGQWIKDPTPGKGGSHGSQHEFLVEKQDADHPIVKGLPDKWRHAQDELYDRLRGPAVNVTVLASAFADSEKGGSGEHEPILMVTKFGEGRCLHTTMGHSTVSMNGIGFQETLKRGAEWVATGKVTFPDISSETLPEDKPGVNEITPAG